MKGWKVCIGALLLCAVLSSAITVDRRKLNLDEIAREVGVITACREDWLVVFIIICIGNNKSGAVDVCVVCFRRFME